MTARVYGAAPGAKRLLPLLWLGLPLCFAALGLALLSSIAFGAADINVATVWRALTAFDGSTDHLIIRTLRVPRAVIGALVGAALAVAGAIMQGLTRNPLASPDITGVTAGASLAVVTLIVMLPGVSVISLPVAALGGGLTVAAIIYLLAWRGGDSPMRLILVGIGLASVLGALTSLMITFGEITQVQRALIWLTGSVYARSWEHVRALLPWLVVCMPIALGLARHLNTLSLGEDVARGLGIRVAWHRGLLLLASVGLVAAAVTAAGTISFVGLMAPHVARRIVGPLHEGVVPISALVGALIVVVADLAGRTLFAPIEIPCGVVTAAVGAPFFVWVLYRNR